MNTPLDIILIKVQSIFSSFACSSVSKGFFFFSISLFLSYHTAFLCTETGDLKYKRVKRTVNAEDVEVLIDSLPMRACKCTRSFAVQALHRLTGCYWCFLWWMQTKHSMCAWPWEVRGKYFGNQVSTRPSADLPMKVGVIMGFSHDKLPPMLHPELVSQLGSQTTSVMHIHLFSLFH